MQQQFFSLSPMAGQESFNAMDVRPQHLMAHTPTTSSMLAALQNDTFNSGSIDPTSSAFNSDGYGSLSYMDTSAPQEDSLPAVQSGLSFPDFSASGNSFDVGGFASQDLGLHSSATPASESDHEPVESVKQEQQQAGA